MAATAGGRRSTAGPRSEADRKRTEAEHRNTVHRATKDLRRRVESSERRWERAEAEVAELQRRLGNPDVYTRPDDVQDLVRRHDAAKQAAADAMAEWEAASTELEETLAELGAGDPRS